MSHYISTLNYREVDIKVYDPLKLTTITFFLSNICFGCVKETSIDNISFMHPKYVFIESF